MELAELIKKIELFAPLQNAASWDKSGLQVASRRTTVHTLAVCLDPTPESLHAAIEQGADCILSHHPLSLSPDLPSRLDDYHEALRLLFCADIPLYAAHTSLDSNPEGPAGWLASELQFQTLDVLEPLPGNAPEHKVGFGFVGKLVKPASTSEIVHTLQQYINMDSALVCGRMPAEVTRIAYCTGSGASLASAAKDSGADIYITGDVKYHTALGTKIPILDVGHHGLEEEMMRRFSKVLQEELPGISVVFVSSSSPFRRIEC